MVFRSELDTNDFVGILELNFYSIILESLRLILQSNKYKNFKK